MDYANENEDFAFEEDDSIEKSVYEQYSSEENLDIKDSNGVSKNGNRYFFYSMLYRKFEFLNPFDKFGNSEFGKDGKEAKYFGIKSDKFKAPYLQINVKRNYSELENREFVTNNPKIPVAEIAKAVQSVTFKLDEKGGEVKSEAAIDMKKNCMAIEVDKVRYFLIDDTFTLFIREEGKETDAGDYILVEMRKEL